MNVSLSTDLFDRIDGILRGAQNRRGWYDADCPFCGKQAKHGQTHFSYSESGYCCFVCGAKGGLQTLASHFRIDDGSPFLPAKPVHREPPPPKPVARWRVNPDALLERYRRHPCRYDAWREYKALTPATVDRFDFGLGPLPFQDKGDGRWYLSASEWLTVPLRLAGALVGLRGRNRTAEGPKWISATGSTYTLWGAEHVQAGSVTWLCENYVDAAWLMQEFPAWSAVAIGGATTWKWEWAQLLLPREPDVVIVALDCDLPGQATGALRRRLEEEWRRTHQGPPPAANGPRIAADLRRAGIRAELFEWPDDTPPKAGVDWMLQRN